VHVGEFLTGSKKYVQSNVQASEKQDDYRDPTTTLPQPPPIQYDNHPISECNTCKHCSKYNSWWDKFKSTVDDILLKSNRQTQNVYWWNGRNR
jgi:hypothetical protein